MQCDVTRIIFISNKVEYLDKELSKLYKSGYIVILIYLSNAINKILDKILFRRYFNELDFWEIRHRVWCFQRGDSVWN